MNAIPLHTPVENTPSQKREYRSVWRVEYIFQKKIATILTRANKASSLEDIARDIAILVKRILKIPWEITVEISPQWEVTTGGISFQVSKIPTLYLHISGIPEDRHEKTRQFLKSIKIQIKNAIDSWEENHTDELTQIYNRKRLTKKKKELDEKNTNYIVFYFDIVWLGDTNDAHGHSAWNVLLTRFAELLKTVFGTNSTNSSIRHGWDEFIVIAEWDESEMDLNSLRNEANGYIRLLQEKIWEYRNAHPKWIRLDAKFGVAIHQRDTSRTATDVIQEADPKWKKNIQRLSQAIPIDLI